MQKTYDRAAEDLGNSVHLEHVNVQIPDQRIAGLFYVVGLGLTRDPYLNVADNNMWINVGRSQFHLPTGNPQVLRGHTGIVMEGREALLARLADVRKKLDGTRFDFAEHNDYVEATCPWGNRIRCYEPDAGALRPPRARFSLCRVRRAGRNRQRHRRFLSPDDRHACRGGERRRHGRARHRRQGPVSPVPRDRPAAAGLRRAPRADLCRGFLRTAPPPEASAVSSTARTTSTSTASATSSISTAASTCSPSSTRCEASPTRCSAAAGQPQSGADHAQFCRRATRRDSGRWGRRTTTTSRSGRCSAPRAGGHDHRRAADNRRPKQ